MVSFTPSEIEAWFGQFWSVYPRRKGSNPKHPAKVKFTAALRSGVTAETIIGGAQRYALQEAKLQHIGTEYIAQAATWLHQKRWDDFPVNNFPSAGDSESGLAGDSIPMIWINKDDPRWPKFAAEYQALKGRPPPAIGGLNGLGWRFAMPLMGTQAPEKKEPPRVASGDGSQRFSAPSTAPDVNRFGPESNMPGPLFAERRETNAGSGAPSPPRGPEAGQHPER